MDDCVAYSMTGLNDFDNFRDQRKNLESSYGLGSRTDPLNQSTRIISIEPSVSPEWKYNARKLEDFSKDLEAP